MFAGLGGVAALGNTVLAFMRITLERMFGNKLRDYSPMPFIRNVSEHGLIERMIDLVIAEVEFWYGTCPVSRLTRT
jgi:hypothetical protein